MLNLQIHRFNMVCHRIEEPEHRCNVLFVFRLIVCLFVCLFCLCLFVFSYSSKNCNQTGPYKCQHVEVGYFFSFCCNSYKISLTSVNVVTLPYQRELSALSKPEFIGLLFINCISITTQTTHLNCQNQPSGTSTMRDQ